MAEILPDGTMQGYYNICKNCGKEIEVNMQGTPINHKCEVKNLDIPHVSGRSEQLVSFLNWYVKDEMMRKEKELITSIVERYLNETNCH